MSMVKNVNSLMGPHNFNAYVLLTRLSEEEIDRLTGGLVQLLLIALDCNFVYSKFTNSGMEIINIDSIQVFKPYKLNKNVQTMALLITMSMYL